jgi:peptidoglycan/LPS O-acetylase OafA/YrhL
MRGIAAIVVVVLHCLHFQGIHPDCLENGFIAVDFFFILSGFVIYHAYAD